MNGMYYRGEIYYITPEGNEFGCEIRSGRPGIVVSNDMNNKHSSTVEIVYLTTKEKKPMPTHVYIDSSQKPSTAICEQVATVDKLRLGDYFGKLTDSEMEAVDYGLIASLGLDNYAGGRQPIGTGAGAEAAPAANIVTPPKDFPSVPEPEYIKACTQRDTYKELCMELIGRKA